MNPLDPIVLIIYVTCIAYFIFKVINSFNDEFTVRLDDNSVKEQLQSLNLQDVVVVSFKFDKRYEFDKLQKLSVSVANKSSTHSIYVDWDCCALTDFKGRSRRVTRLMPGTTLDLFQEQAFSTISPDTTLSETITAEDVLQRKDPKAAVALEMEVSKPLVDPTTLKPVKSDPARFARFMKRLVDLDFNFDLAIRIAGPTRLLEGDRAVIRCKLLLSKIPWQAALPWNPKD